MRKFYLNIYKYLMLILLLSICNHLEAQINNGIFFQAVARDNFANPAKDRKIYVQSNIIQKSTTGTKVLCEEHQANTDASGVFSITLGNGIRFGGTASSLTNIDWSNGPFYLNLKVAITPIGGTSSWEYTKEWVDMGTTSFGAVPYALYSASAGGLEEKLNVVDTTKMLALYAKSQLVQSLSSTVNSKLNVNDTTTMLAPYAKMVNDLIASNITSLTAASVNAALNSKVNIVDSGIVYITPTQLAAKTFDQTPITNAIATKLNIEDTISLSNRIALNASTTDLSNLTTFVNANTASITTNALNINSNTSSITAAYAAIDLKLDANKIGVANGVASLNINGVIPNNQIPAISFQSATVVSSESAMLALNNALVGSFAIRSDNNKNFVLSALPANILANWIELASTASVKSVNGFIGPIVNLAVADISGAEAVTNKSIAIDLGNSNPSDLLYPSQKAVKNYVDAQNAAAGVADASITSVKIGGSIAVNKGGTGATTAADARTNLGLVIGTNVQGLLTAGTDYLTPTGSAANLTNFPILNQNTTGNAATASTATIAGNITATSNTSLTSIQNLATIGTITSGTWSATTIDIAHGGTGATTLSGIVKGNGASALTAAVAGLDYQAPITLTTTGSGAATLSGTTLNIPSATSTVTAGSISGTINIANGGTGATSKLTAFDALSPMTSSGDIIFGGTNGSGTRLGKGTNGMILTMENNTPQWLSSIRATAGSTYNAAVGYAFIGGDWAKNTGMFSDNPDAGDAVLKFRITGNSKLTIDPNIVAVLPTTISTSKTTGALTVAGGLGVNGDIYASNLNISGAITNGTWSATTIDIVHGGTGATTSADALTKIGAAPLNANLNDQIGTTYSLAASDNGKVITLNNASAITLTVPVNLAVGFNCMIVQKGAGVVTISPTSPVTVTNRSGGTKTAGQNAIVTIISIETNKFITGGDMQ